MRTLAVSICMLFALSAAAEEKAVAVLPVAPRAGVLQPADAAAVTAEIRAAAREALAPHGFTVVDAEGTAAAAFDAGAAAVLFGRATQMEGATVVAVGLYKPGAAAPAAVARVVGIGIAQLKDDARAKITGLVATGLGLAAAVPEAPQARGTLRMPPGSVPAESPAPPPPPATPTPAPAAAPAPAPEGPSRVNADVPASEVPLVTLIRDVTDDVERLRGLRRKRNLKVQILDEKLFSRALREKAEKELPPGLVAQERARWTAFDLAPPGADPRQIILGVLDEQVAGFYDPFTQQLIVRKDPPASAGDMGADGLRIVLAHEIEHALQDQNFGIPDLQKLPDDDVRLARSALFEGDAMAVMTAYAARRAHKPVKVAIAAGAAALRALDTEMLLRASGKSPALLHAPAILREELVMPYAAGFALVAEVYRRGGFALVDKMFRNPPQSTHQVLHPDAYFAGEQPVAVPAPAAPPGTRIVATGRMGELGTRIALEVCVDRGVVKDFAPRLSGDAYTVVEGPGRALTLLWTTAWAGEAASHVSNLLELEQPCWEDAASPAMPAASKIATARNLVALARGAGGLDLRRQLAARVPEQRLSPPLGDVPPPPAIGPVKLENGRFVSARLALEGELPDGYRQDSGNPAAELSLKRQNAGGASLILVPEPLKGEAQETFFEKASAQIATAQGGHLAYVGGAKRKLAGIDADERSWTLEGTQTTVRIDVAPFCGGLVSLALVRVETGIAAREVLERFTASIQPTGKPPVCAELE